MINNYIHYITSSDGRLYSYHFKGKRVNFFNSYHFKGKRVDFFNSYSYFITHSLGDLTLKANPLGVSSRYRSSILIGQRKV